MNIIYIYKSRAIIFFFLRIDQYVGKIYYKSDYFHY